MKKKIICFDIDGVICTTKKNNYSQSKPNKEVIKIINFLHNKGHIVKIFTSRYMGRSNEKKTLAKNRAETITKKQLKKWGVKYSYLIFGKPSYDYFIDDKAYNFKDKWKKIIFK